MAGATTGSSQATFADYPPIEVVEEAGSTNDELLKRVRAGHAQPGEALMARRQTAGRGRRGHAWESPAGNLYLSIVLAADVPPVLLSGLSAACGLGAVEGLAAAGYADEVQLKWPNDLVAHGCKLGGVLVELAEAPDGQRLAVCGIGVNAHAPALGERGADEPTRLDAIGLADLAAGAPEDVVALAESVRAGIVARAEGWADGVRAAAPEAGPLSPILGDYAACLAFLGEEVEALAPDGTPVVRGWFDGVDGWGRAMVQGPEGDERHLAAEQASIRPIANGDR